MERQDTLISHTCARHSQRLIDIINAIQLSNVVNSPNESRGKPQYKVQ